MVQFAIFGAPSIAPQAGNLGLRGAMLRAPIKLYHYQERRGFHLECGDVSRQTKAPSSRRTPKRFATLDLEPAIHDHKNPFASLLLWNSPACMKSSVGVTPHSGHTQCVEEFGI